MQDLARRIRASLWKRGVAWAGSEDLLLLPFLGFHSEALTRRVKSCIRKLNKQEKPHVFVTILKNSILHLKGIEISVLINRIKIRHQFGDLRNFNKVITWHVTWSKSHWKFQLGEANITRDIAKTKWQLEIRLRPQAIISQVLNCLGRPATIGVFKFSITLFNLLQFMRLQSEVLSLQRQFRQKVLTSPH